MESIKAGEMMGRASGSANLQGERLMQQGEQLASVTARRRSMANARRLWTREDGFTLAGVRRA